MTQSVSDTMAKTVVEFHEVVRVYGRRTPFSGSRRTVLDHVNLRIPAGRILCLLGPSGAGKTTMVSLVMGIAVPQSGSVTVLGQSAPYRDVRSEIGYMPQDEALYDDITAEENLRFFGAMQGVRGRRLVRRVDEMLAFARLRDDRKRLVSTFSGGMKRRLSLAIALLHDPALLVLDEPTVGLDPDHRIRIWKAFRRMAAAGKTLLVTTHVMDEAEHCDEIAMLHAGSIIAAASPREILEQTDAADLDHAFLKLSRSHRSVTDNTDEADNTDETEKTDQADEIGTVKIEKAGSGQ